jgi:hypothetical protein
LEVADIFRSHGLAWRQAHAGHVSLDQLKVMSAIERCRTAALGGHVARCADCAYTTIAYNSCRNRHCPKCQGGAAKDWLADREAELLPVPYFHVVYALPSELRDIAYQNKRVVYNLLMKAAAETTLAVAADPKLEASSDTVVRSDCNDWYLGGRAFGDQGNRDVWCDYEVYVEPNEIIGHIGEKLTFPGSQPPFNVQVCALLVTQLPEAVDHPIDPRHPTAQG